MNHPNAVCLARTMRALEGTGIEPGAAFKILDNRLDELGLRGDLSFSFRSEGSGVAGVGIQSLSSLGDDLVNEIQTEMAAERVDESVVVLQNDSDCLWCGASLRG